MNMELFISAIQTYVGGIVVDIILALIVLVIGLTVINRVVGLVKRLIEPTKIDPTLKPFLASLTSISLRVLLVIGVISIAGYDAMSLVAVLGAASLAIGLAFQGALSNFAGGVLLLSLRPFHVNDFIEVSGHIGKVEAIHVFNTVLITLDNKVVSIPNGQVANGAVVNFTQKDTRRVDFSFGVGYDSDLKKVAKLIEDIANAHPLVHKDPEPFIRLGEQGDSSLNFTVRLWCNTEHYWDVYFDVMAQVTDSFNENGVSIPFPQMDVHLDQQQ